MRGVRAAVSYRRQLILRDIKGYWFANPAVSKPFAAATAPWPPNMAASIKSEAPIDWV